MSTLSVLIPARNEEWLARTVADVLAHSGEQTDIIVVLDGAWADPPLDEHPRVTVVYRPVSIGQRAATNLAARISTADYILKLDAHCAVAPGFDQALLEAAAVLPRETLQVPAQKALHIFDWVCRGTGNPFGCGWREYQGPSPGACPKCGGMVNREIVWRLKRGSTTTQWFFDNTLHFQYYDGERRPFAPKQSGDYPPTMSLLGASWFANREWFLQDLEGLDEAHGSWGNMGTELSCKAWLSGGRVVCNTKTWYAHLFRTRKDFSFPYDIKHSDQEAARKYSRDLWLNNRWPRQTRPLVELVQQFAPVPTWDSVEAFGPRPYELAETPDKAAIPPSPAPCDNVAAPPSDQPRLLQAATGRTGTSSPPGVATGALGVDPAGMSAETPTHRETALPEPDDDDTMAAGVALGILTAETSAAPRLEESRPTAGILYYTDSRGDEVVLAAARRQLVHAAAGLPIVAVSLPRYPVDNVIGAQGLVRIEGGPADAFAGMRHVVLPLERGYLTMARQILTGLELLDTDVVFFCEHDCLYPAGYFDHRPMPGIYEYAGHTWKVDAASGRALTYEMQQLSGLCGERRLLLDHFRRRVAHIEQHGFSRRMGFEPGKPVRHGGLDDVPRATWANLVPIVDIRHGHNLTPSRWSKDQFRNQKYTAGWLEGDAIPGWGRTAGRFSAWLAEVTTHGD